MALPTCVLDAKKIDFGVQVTGYLCCAEFQPPCVIGVVFSESRGRFTDGKNDPYFEARKGVRTYGISAL